MWRDAARFDRLSMFARGASGVSRFVASPFASRSRSRLRSSLGASCAEGFAAEVATACTGGAVLTTWALHLGASPAYVGLLGAAPFVAQLVQVPAACLTARAEHRRVALTCLAAARFAMLWAVVLPFLPLAFEVKRAIVLTSVTLTCVLAVVGVNAWSAWMADVVPAPLRGRYFGNRTAICAIGGASASFLAGFLLDRARDAGTIGMTLSALGAIAVVFALGATFLLSRQAPGARIASEGQRRPTLREAFAILAAPGARRYSAFVAVWGAAIGFAGSFYVVHMLQNLKLSYVAVAAHGTCITAMRILSAPLWGRVIDRAGAKPVLVGCSAGLASMPILWLCVSTERTWPLVFDAVIAGVLWSGHALSSFALPLAIAPRASRRITLAVFATTGGVAFAFASSLGGLVAARLPERVTLLGLPIFGVVLLFVASGLLQIAAVLVAFRIDERRAAAPRAAPAPARSAVQSLAADG